MAVNASLWVKYPFASRFVLGILIPFTIVGVLVFIALQNSLPKINGELRIAGLAKPVTVHRDSQAIPEILASSDHDAYFALGFVHAQDRLWQMEMDRRIGAGRLSEILGESSIDADIAMRRIGLYANARKIWGSLGAENRQLLQKYVDGINAGILNLSVLPVEFQMLDYRPETWKPEDSLVLMQVLAWKYSSNLSAEIQRMLLIRNFGLDIAKALMPGTTKDLTGSVAKVKLLSDISTKLNESILGESKKSIGSNAWVISGKYTASGLPIMANDPHLTTPIPSLWYLANIKGNTLDIVGATLPGLPFVLIGRNQHIAWGLTNAVADTQDVIMEEINPLNKDQYKVNDRYVDMVVKTEEIKIKKDFLRPAREPFMITVRRTKNGPMVSDILGALGKVSFSVRWTGDDDTGGTFNSFLKLNYAKNWDEFNAALSTYVSPIHHFIYADKLGNIGYVAPGLYPIRKAGNGSVPVPSSIYTDDIWSGFIPYTAIPRSFNPVEGLIIAANNKFVSNDYPYHISVDWGPDYRANRIREELQRRIKETGGKLQLKDMTALQLDSRTPAVANGILRLMQSLPAKKTSQEKVLSMLFNWNGDMTEDSPSATLFVAWTGHLNQLILEKMIEDGERSSSNGVPLLSMRYHDNSEFLETVLRGPDKSWCQKFANDPNTLCNDLLYLALDRAIVELNTLLGSNENDWHWGRVHKTKFSHFPFSKPQFSPGMPVIGESPISSLFDRTVASSGGNDTVNVGSLNFDKKVRYMQFLGAMYRQVIDFGAPATSVFSQGTGQSGNPFSSHYDDLIEPHKQGRYIPMFDRPKTEILRLIPSR